MERHYTCKGNNRRYNQGMANYTDMDRIADEAELLVLEELLVDYEAQLTWLESEENSPQTNRDYDLTERDIAFYQEELLGIRRGLLRLQKRLARACC